MSSNSRKAAFAAVTLLVLAVTFAIDLMVPMGVNAWVPYLIAVVLAPHAGGPRAVVVTTLVALVLMAADFFIGAPGAWAMGAVNRPLGIALIGVCGFITWGQARTAAALRREMAERRAAEGALEELILELRQAGQEIRTLRGLIPICSYCKKIRDDAGLWKQLEAYLREHTAAEFTHGICPCCMDRQLAQFARDTAGAGV